MLHPNVRVKKHIFPATLQRPLSLEFALSAILLSLMINTWCGLH